MPFFSSNSAAILLEEQHFFPSPPLFSLQVSKCKQALVVIASALLCAATPLVWANEASDQVPVYVTNQTDSSVSHLSLMNTPGSLSSTRIASEAHEKKVGYVQVDQKTGVQFSFNHGDARNVILYNSVLLPSDLRKASSRRIDLVFFPSIAACQQYAYVGGICPMASPTAYMHCFALSPGAATGPAVGSAVCLPT